MRKVTIEETFVLPWKTQSSVTFKRVKDISTGDITWYKNVGSVGSAHHNFLLVNKIVSIELENIYNKYIREQKLERITNEPV